MTAIQSIDKQILPKSWCGQGHEPKPKHRAQSASSKQKDRPKKVLMNYGG